ncbi:hypothetical protein BASA81_013374 [Batrachochytrium salamandrivorans]|nr:hypothetical protein BASA81_013374 [Batrachochytrium salamandrivorans]
MRVPTNSPTIVTSSISNNNSISMGSRADITPDSSYSNPRNMSLPLSHQSTTKIPQQTTSISANTANAAGLINAVKPAISKKPMQSVKQVQHSHPIIPRQLSQQQLLSISQNSRSPSPMLDELLAAATTTTSLQSSPLFVTSTTLYSGQKKPNHNMGPFNDSSLYTTKGLENGQTTVQMQMSNPTHYTHSGVEQQQSRSSTPSFSISRENSPASRCTDLVSIHSAQTDPYPYLDPYARGISGNGITTDDVVAGRAGSEPGCEPGAVANHMQLASQGLIRNSRLHQQQQYYQNQQQLHLNQLQIHTAGHLPQFDPLGFDVDHSTRDHLKSVQPGTHAVSGDLDSLSKRRWSTTAYPYDLQADMDMDTKRQRDSQPVDIALNHMRSMPQQGHSFRTDMGTETRTLTAASSNSSLHDSRRPSSQLHQNCSQNGSVSSSEKHISKMMGSLEFNSAIPSPTIGLDHTKADAAPLGDDAPFLRPSLDASASSAALLDSMRFVSQQKQQDSNNAQMHQYFGGPTTAGLTGRLLLDESRTLSGQSSNHQQTLRPFHCHYSCPKSYKNANGLKYHLIHVHGEYPASSGIHTPLNNSGSGGSTSVNGGLGSSRGSGSFCLSATSNASGASTILHSTASGSATAIMTAAGALGVDSNTTFIHPANRKYQCPISSVCTKPYKSVGGLRYHLKHAHEDLSKPDWDQVIAYAREIAERGSTQLRLNITTGLGPGVHVDSEASTHIHDMGAV